MSRTDVETQIGSSIDDAATDANGNMRRSAAAMLERLGKPTAGRASKGDDHPTAIKRERAGEACGNARHLRQLQPFAIL
jgi:hypothetical protein